MTLCRLGLHAWSRVWCENMDAWRWCERCDRIIGQPHPTWTPAKHRELEEAA